MGSALGRAWKRCSEWTRATKARHYASVDIVELELGGALIAIGRERHHRKRFYVLLDSQP